MILMKAKLKPAVPLSEIINAASRDHVATEYEACLAAFPYLQATAIKAMVAQRLKVSIATVYRLMKQPGRGPMAGKVYLMRHACGQYKIGYTAGNPKLRERTLQAEDPQLELVQWWMGNTADEMALHAVFAPKRTRGEWFRLDESDIATIRKYMRNRVSAHGPKRAAAA